MSADAWVLLLLIGIAAGGFLVHVLLLIRIISTRGLSKIAKWISLIPLATPFYAWTIGRRWLVVLWSLLGFGYLLIFTLRK